MKTNKLVTGVGILWAVLVFGYVANIVKVVDAFVGLDAFGDATVTMYVQAAGIVVAPVGAITGLLIW